MVSKTTSFKKGKGKNGYFMKRQISSALVKKPKVEPKPETKCFCNEGTVTEAELPRYLVDEKAGKVDRSILDIHCIRCVLY